MSTKTTLIEQLDPLRGNDQYPSQEIKDQLIQLYLPASVSDLTLNLSNITSQFYALLLQSIGAKYGVAAVQEHSETLFHHLGKVKAEQAYTFKKTAWIRRFFFNGFINRFIPLNLH